MIQAIIHPLSQIEPSLNASPTSVVQFNGIERKCTLTLVSQKWIHLTGAKGLIPICYGASENVYPSGMCLDMSSGSRAYLWGKTGPLCLVDIFATGPEVIPSTVADQSDSFAKK